MATYEPAAGILRERPGVDARSCQEGRITREAKLQRTCAALVEMMLALGAETETAYKVAGLFAEGVRREWERRAT